MGCHSFCLLQIFFKKTKSGHHANDSEQNITTSLNLSSHHTHILSMPQQNKTMKHSQEHLEFILLKITPSPHQNYHNIYAFWQSLIIDKIWPPCNKIKSEHHNISKFLLPPYTHPKHATAKENFEALSRSLRYHTVKDTTISSSKAPHSHVKLVTYMNNYNDFELIIAAVFARSPQI